MLELSKVDEIATAAAAAVLKKPGISRVFSKPTLDSWGEEALEVTVVLKKSTAEEVTGDQALDTIFKIGWDLDLSGEDRSPIVRFVTEEDLAAWALLDANGDTES